MNLVILVIDTVVTWVGNMHGFVSIGVTNIKIQRCISPHLLTNSTDPGVTPYCVTVIKCDCKKCKKTEVGLLPGVGGCVQSLIALWSSIKKDLPAWLMSD